MILQRSPRHRHAKHITYHKAATESHGQRAQKFSFWDMRVDRQTDRQTHEHAHRNTPHRYRVGVERHQRGCYRAYRADGWRVRIYVSALPSGRYLRVTTCSNCHSQQASTKTALSAWSHGHVLKSAPIKLGKRLIGLYMTLGEINFGLV